MLTNMFRTNFHFHKGISPDLALPLTSRKAVHPPAVDVGEEKIWPASYVKEMLSFNNMVLEGYKKALKMADLPEGSFGLDAGCGPGGVLPLEASAIGHKGKILGLEYTPDHETPEWGDKTYLDFQLSQVFLNSLRDLHNGYNFPILDCTNKEYFPNSEHYYFRLLPQVNIGTVKK